MIQIYHKWLRDWKRNILTNCPAGIFITHFFAKVLTLFGLRGGGGGGGFWCPRQLWIARNFRQFKIILSYHRTFPQIYLAVWWCGRILVMGSDVAMATAFWRACLAEIWISCLFFYIKLDWYRVFWSPWTLLFWEKCYFRFFGRSLTYRFRCKV